MKKSLILWIAGGLVAVGLSFLPYVLVHYHLDPIANEIAALAEQEGGFEKLRQMDLHYRGLSNPVSPSLRPYGYVYIGCKGGNTTSYWAEGDVFFTKEDAQKNGMRWGYVLVVVNERRVTAIEYHWF